MSKFKKFCKTFIQDEEGLTVVEYVVGAGLLVGGLTVIFSNLGTSLSTALNNAIDGIGS
mgnify:CR=1 FL=1